MFLSISKVQISISLKNSLFNFGCASALGKNIKTKNKQKNATFNCKIMSIKKVKTLENHNNKFSKTRSLSWLIKTINYN